MNHSDTGQPREVPEAEPRRGFLAKTFAVVFAGIVGLFPFAAGLCFFLDPLWRRGTSLFVRVTSLEALSDQPRVFTLVGTRVDAWNRYTGRLGAVYITRLPDRDGQAQLRVFQTLCPHLGCFVNYNASAERFDCPCHKSSFQLDGSKIPGSVAIRGLDELEWKVEGGDVLVKFQKFRSGPYKESIPV